MIVSSPGSPSSKESAGSPEPINKSLLGGLGLDKSNGVATTTAAAASTTAAGTSGGPGTEQITPTSSVDTEEGNPAHEEGEKGVEGDAEASDDDRHQHVPKTH